MQENNLFSKKELRVEMKTLKNIFLFIILSWFAVLNYAVSNSQTINSAESPYFSHKSGFYFGSIQVSIRVTSPDGRIYYTLDCSDPTEQSFLYINPI